MMSGRRFCAPRLARIQKTAKVSFTLIDLDGDGKRDLIIDSYVGGTGLFSYTGCSSEVMMICRRQRQRQ